MRNDGENVKPDRASENGGKEDLIKQKQEEASDTLSAGGSSQDVNYLPLDGSEHNNIPHGVTDLCSQSVESGFKDATETTAGPHDTEETLQLQVSVSGMEAEAVGSEPATTKSESFISGISPITDKKFPPGLVRKRMKPAVNIPAATRRPREPSGVLNADKFGSVSSTVNCNKNVPEEYTQQHTVRNESVSEEASLILPCYSEGNNEAPLSSGKGIGAGVPGITQIIPTGTAIRPQYEQNICVSTLDKGEAPQSLPEPDLPSEGAGGGYSNTLWKPSSSQVKVVQRSRFIKPSPCILDPSIRKRKFVGSSASSSESDDLRKADFSDSLPYHMSGKVMLEHGRSRPAWQTSDVPDETEGRKQGSGASASASESEEESRRCVLDVSSVSPLMRKPIDTSKGRFVRPTPRLVEASVRQCTQSSVDESEEFKKTTSVAAAPHKRQTDVTR
jgi:hypothetical protein